jgi:hypothetical protein
MDYGTSHKSCVFYFTQTPRNRLRKIPNKPTAELLSIATL